MRQAAILIAAQIAMYASVAFIEWNPLWFSMLGGMESGERLAVAWIWVGCNMIILAFSR